MNYHSALLKILITLAIAFPSGDSYGTQHRLQKQNTSRCMPLDLDGPLEKSSKHTTRFASFNAYLNRSHKGELISDLIGSRNPQIKAVAEIIQRVNPDILLINEFDFDEDGLAADIFRSDYLEVAQNGQKPIRYPYMYLAPANTGILSGKDLDNDGAINIPNDAFGFGFFAGQYAMVLYSKYPIVRDRVRTFQNFLWKDMPNSLLPEDYYSLDAKEVFRLSSKSHWDIPIRANGKIVHLLAAHPTPPVFDGDEDRNGRRNHDEIRFWADYVGDPLTSGYIYDDQGRRGGLSSKSPFVIMGDYNADPYDGDSTNKAIQQLLEHPAIYALAEPASDGGLEDAKAEGNINDSHKGNAALDTGDFNSTNPGNLRVDYILPSKKGLNPICGGVFWPKASDETRYLVGDGLPVVSSDHRLVWYDIEIH